jgi:phosphoenolpyruvate carboxykinase (GTP)
MDAAALAELLSVDVDQWKEEAKLSAADFEKFGDRLPAQLQDQQSNLEARLNAAG